MKNLLLFIFIFISQLSFAQEKNNQEIEIVFKPKSAKLSKIEKEKIRKFVDENPIDSTWQYKIYSCSPVHSNKAHLNWERVFKVISFFKYCGINRNRFILMYDDDNCTVTKNIQIQKIVNEDITPPPFPNLRK